jgi:YVTN family beta-propeller protein
MGGRSGQVRAVVAVAGGLTAAALAAYSGPGTRPIGASASGVAGQSARPVAGAAVGLPGMPPLLDPDDVYAADRPGQLSDVVKGFPTRVYVPNLQSNDVTVIDPASYKVIGTLPVGREPQHVVPSWDLRTLWVTNDLGVQQPLTAPLPHLQLLIRRWIGGRRRGLWYLGRFGLRLPGWLRSVRWAVSVRHGLLP